MPDIKPKVQVKSSRTDSAAEIENMYAGEPSDERRAGEELMTGIPMPQDSLAPPKKKPKGKRAFWTFILIIVLVLVILLIISKTTNWDILGVSGWDVPLVQKPGGDQLGEVSQASDWQAVFLTNNQVYFGKLSNIDDNYPVLEDIYYLQVQEVPIQPAPPAGGEEGVQPAQQTEQRTILVKFGTELHRPMDRMYINKEHILMFEDLASDSNVVIAIENYKKQQVQ